MPQVFSHDPELDDPVLLIHAYRFADDPKPSLGNVIAQIRKGEIKGVRSPEGVWMVNSISEFVEQLDDWKLRTNWSHVSVYSALPEGTVGVVAWCREKVTTSDGHAKGLFDRQGNKGTAQLSGHARELISAGTLVGATYAHRIWAARPDAIRDWLYAEFRIVVR